LTHSSDLFAVSPIDAASIDFSRHRLLHHVGLNGQRPPGIKNGQQQVGLPCLKVLLRCQEAIHHTGAQLKGICARAIGGTSRDVRVWFESQQGWRQRHKGLPVVVNRTITPGTHGLAETNHG
jgi:hypothetical protein